MNSLFSPNGLIGRGAYAEAEFPTAASLADHLDRLGIDRSLVWHVSARDLNPTLGNRRILEEISGAGLGHRLIPGFAVTPACFFENGALEFLRESLRSGATRALRVFPELGRFPIREIERLLGELAPDGPVLFWDCPHQHNELDLRDFEHLANAFPRLTFVITQKMWGGFHGVLDAMWRCPNLCVDTSWLHMRGTIELLCERFDAGRVLFGVGFKAHHGAAVAALAHARIPEDDRERIAHENLERILNLPPVSGLARPEPGRNGRNRLWEPFRAGRALEVPDVIDAHGHTPPHTRGWVLRESGFDAGMAEVVGNMDRLGIRRIIVSPGSALFGDNLAGNREAERLLAPLADRVSAYLVFNPLYAEDMVPELDAFFDRGLYVGFKVLAAYWKRPLRDPGFLPVWETANRRRLPILIHTWDDRYNSPAQLEAIAPAYPDASFLLGHSGGGTAGRLEAEELARANPNVYLEFCGSFTTPRPFEVSLERVGRNRVIFGTDTDAHDPAWELGRYLSMPLPDEVLLPGLGANMRGILSRARRGQAPQGR